MPIQLTCARCGQVSNVHLEFKEQRIPCPNCGAELNEVVELTRVQPPVDSSTSAGNTFEKDAHSYDSLFPTSSKREFQDLIDMTAMVDIVFFLLIFFLVTSFVQLSASIQAPSGEATLGKTARSNSERENVQTLTVRIDSDDVVWIDQDPVMGTHDLVARLRTAKDESGAEGLRIASSGDASHGKLVMVLDAGVSAGFESAQLAVEETQ